MDIGDDAFHISGLSQEILHVRMKHIVVLGTVSTVYTGYHPHLLLEELNALLESRYHHLLFCKLAVFLDLHSSRLLSTQL